MTTFKQFLTEDIKDIDYLIKYIEDNCVSYLNKSGRKNLLIRGVKNPGRELFKLPESSVYLKQPHDNRIPKDTSLSLHDKLNNYFNTNFGFKARSDKVIFVLGSSKTSILIIENAGYGDPYIVFPVGDFTYVWSPKIADLFVTTYDNDLNYKTDKEITEFLDSKHYQNDNLQDAIKTTNELMIQCEYYLAIDINLLPVLKEKLNISL